MSIPRRNRLLLSSAAVCFLGGVPAIGMPAPPTWSSEFTSAGVINDQFSDGPISLCPFQTPAGPRLFVGGEFTAVRLPPGGSLAAQGVAVWDGAHWSGISGGGVPSDIGGGTVQAITVFPVGGVPRIVLAGFFDAPGTSQGIAYLDDARVLHPLPSGPIANAWFGGAYGWTPPGAGAVPEIIVTSGVFPTGSDYAYRFTSTGHGLVPPGLITVTNAFAEFDDGTGRALYIGVPMVGAPAGGKIARWNGTTLTSINPGPMTWVNALTVHDDGSGGGPALYAAGQAGIRRYRSGTWDGLTGGPGFNINALASFDDGSGPALYVAGQFTVTAAGPAGPVTATNIVRLRAGVWEALGSGLVGGLVKTLAVFDEDGPGPRPAGLFAGGKFTTAGGQSSVGIARWGTPICRADHNAVGGLNSQDIFDFLNDWLAGNARADFNGGGLASSDIFDFIAAWFIGC